MEGVHIEQHPFSVITLQLEQLLKPNNLHLIILTSHLLRR